MSSPLITIGPNRPMLDASHLMETKRVRHLAVSEGAEVLGVISVRDLVRHFVEADGGPVQSLNDVYRPLSVLMNKAIVTIGSDGTALAAAQRMADKHIGALFVMEAEQLVGIMTEADLVRKLLAQRLDPATTKVGALMNSPLLDIDINRTIHDASQRMAKIGSAIWPSRKTERPSACCRSGSGENGLDPRPPGVFTSRVMRRPGRFTAAADY